MYVKETVYAGETIEVRKYHTIRFSRRGQRRGAPVGATCDRQKKINHKNAARKLRQLINANFGPGDLHLILTYRREDRPDAATAKQCAAKFLRQLRKAFAAEGRELKYIQVAPEKAAGAIHHHLVINHCDLRIIRDLWPHGGVHPSVLDGSGNYARLADYLIKETENKLARGKDADAMRATGIEPCGKRWSSSRNLVKPVIKREIIKADTWRKKPTAPHGYIIEIDSIEDYVTQDGYAAQSYIMRRTRPCSRKKTKGGRL